MVKRITEKSLNARRLRILAPFLFASCSLWAQGVAWDSSGNGTLQGSHFFRHVFWAASGARGDFNQRVALYGTITFDGRGAYTLAGSRFDSADPRLEAVALSGTYTISAGGHGFLSNPMGGATPIHGMASSGIFVGSSTEAGRNDLFIAARGSATGAVTGDFNGSYWLAHLDFPSPDPADARDALFELRPNGQGGLGIVSLSGYIGANATRVQQSGSSPSYSFANGIGSIVFGGALTAQTLVAGTKVLYISADRNFIFGGASNGWDMFVGVRALSGTAGAATRNGLYYFAGARENLGNLNRGVPDLETYYGAFSSRNGTVIAHRRLYALTVAPAYDFTYRRDDTIAADATVTTTSFRYVLGAGGAIQIGSGTGPLLGIDVAIKAPSFSGTGVFLDPAGVVNAASSTPFTVGISRGGLITLYGSNLSTATTVDARFPQTLSGVQVVINNRSAPIYVVSPTQVSAVVPFAITGDLAAVRVINNGTSSNTVTVPLRKTTPGSFTIPPGGAGNAAALQADFSLITQQNPARPGGVVQLFIAGLGEVNPSITDGAPGPGNPLSRTTNPIAVFLDGAQAPILYSGLPPGLTGLYQINFTVPGGVAPGDVFLEVAGPDSFSSQALLPVGLARAADPPDRKAARETPPSRQRSK